MAVNSDVNISFNRTSASSLGLYTVSDGSRYTENLSPTIQDDTLQIPGYNGLIFLESTYKQQTFQAHFAFKDQPITLIRDLKGWLMSRGLKDFTITVAGTNIFSGQAKVNDPPQLKYLPVDNGHISGELTVNFICYGPFNDDGTYKTT